MEWAKEKAGDEVQMEGEQGQGHDKDAEFHSQTSLAGYVLPPPSAERGGSPHGLGSTAQSTLSRQPDEDGPRV